MNTMAAMRPAAHVAVADMEGEAVLLNISTGVYFSLNQVAARIWRLIAHGSSVDAIVQTLMDEFDVGEERLRGDVAETIHQLSAHGLIDVARAS